MYPNPKLFAHPVCPGYNESFDAERAFGALRQRYQEISTFLLDYLDGGESMQTRNLDSNQKIEDLIRIIGGKETKRFPQTCLVGILQQNGSFPVHKWFCSGILVHERLVLTAAHCYRPDYQYIVALNTSSQNDLSSPAEVHLVNKAIVRPDYFPHQTYHDITALLLKNPSQLRPIPLASQEEINQAEEVTLVGFGNSDRHSTRGFGIKREVEVPIISIQRSKEDNIMEDEMTHGFEADLEFVSGGRGFDSCKGDSGGPALIKVGGDYKLAGITSRATRNFDTLCGDGGIYTRIDRQKAWINQILDTDYL